MNGLNRVPVDFNVVDSVGFGGSVRGSRDGKLSADRAGGASWDLAMARHRRPEVAFGVVPDAMSAALAKQFTAVRGQVPLEVAARHAARSMVIVSA